MSASSQTLSQYGAIRIVSLPSGFETYDTAKYLVEHILDLGRVSDLQVKLIKQTNGASYHTAVVDFHYWAKNPFSVWLQQELIRVVDECASNGKASDAEKTSIQIPSTCVNIDPLVVGPHCPTSFTFANGKPMTHLSIRAMKTFSETKGPVSLEGMEPLFYADQEPDRWSSIYIPVIMPSMYYQGKWMGDSTNIPHLEANLKMLFEEKMCLGRVSRIDFVEEKKDDKVTLKAFVHFSWWAKTSLSTRETLEKDSQIRLRGVYNHVDGKMDVFRKSPDDYYGPSAVFLPLRINHKPIPASTGILNVHQLAAILKEKTEQIEFLLPKTTELLERLTIEGCVSWNEGEGLLEKIKEIEEANAKGKV